MSKVAFVKLLLVFICAAPAVAQKVKYKDIFGLLSTKQYESAEPFLRKYLKENIDNPNAYLYMGIIQQERSGKEDILKSTSKAIAHMDSAIYFFDKAYKGLTEKEVKRNDEYYQIYNRRDLRTGEFGVKLSDIQFDLEKRMEGLREKIDRVKMIKHYFVLADSFYTKTRASYTRIQQAYPSEKALYLRADETTVQLLQVLVVRYDSCLKAFESYKGSLANLGSKTGYNQVLAKNEIKDFPKDGSTKADFYQDEVQVWDYKKFAENTKLIIEKEIQPMRDHLVSYDVEINKLREKLNKDSVSVHSDLTKLIDRMLITQLSKYDSDPLPMDVFTLKIADLEYRSIKIENQHAADSANIITSRERINRASNYLMKLDSVADKMSKQDLDKEAEDYGHFISHTYSNTVVLKSYVKALKEYAERERRAVDKRIAALDESLRWIVSSPDSIPLFLGKTTSRFKPLHLVADKYTTGLAYKDSLTAEGYFYTITPTRMVDVKVLFPVDKQVFKLSKLSHAKSLVHSDAAGQVFYVLVYSGAASKENKYTLSLAKLYRSDGLAWNNNYAVSFLPQEILYKQETGELVIKNETQQLLIDKNGKAK
ncbi:hypothetical protein [Pseudochryseolinea flava]|uniref:Uncharacterized protein n=1 Tax=Pseudochryseolinea flava TaxID=2059302 RepID=A0A364Y109_9BACT|nr:hypothetical protein [Pseudochryseolinea flava]RAV99617.1 hypothetical protein DQQ10_18635 [Pseudochryseolinea flava]